jgi:alpha-N-arabinofuranosidase
MRQQGVCRILILCPGLPLVLRSSTKVQIPGKTMIYLACKIHNTKSAGMKMHFDGSRDIHHIIHTNMNRLFLFFITCFMLLISTCNNEKESIYVNLKEGKAVSPVIYGWHYEEIGMIGEGGLYAEMVRNRGLEEANPPRGLVVKEGVYANIPDPTGNPRKKVYDIDPLIGWGKLEGSGTISLERVTVNPLNDQNPHSLQIDIKDIPEGKDAGVFNSGFFGMNLREGLEYELSFYARGENYNGALAVRLTDSSGTDLSSVFSITGLEGEWRKYDTILVATGKKADGILLFTPESTGTVWLDMVTLFPGDTWDQGKSVFRSDIMQNLFDYAPEFIRFPGGCLVHGVNVETMYHWKETIGDIAERPGGWSKWSPNYRTDGLGYHEFYELCEYLGADAMYVTPSGLVCTGWVFQDGDSDHYFHPDVDVQEYIQDCLDAIEYAVGPIDSPWGSKRAENGHPEPFPLKYIEIGNEDFGPMYYKNYDPFYRAIKTAYPDLKIIANSIIGNTPDRTDKRKRLKEFKDVSTVKIFDEHYYKDLSWVIENYHKFDRYDRPGPGLMIGELGIRGEYPLDVLGEAVFMTMVERNADLNPICADRPLMRNWTYVEGRGNPLYFHTNQMSWKTTNYYQSKMYRDHAQDTWYESVHTLEDGTSEISFETLFTSAGKDSRTGDILLKVINLTDRRRTVSLKIGEERLKSLVTVTTLTARNDQKNTQENPFNVTPRVRNLYMKFPSNYTFEPRSFTVFRIKPQP